MLTGRQIGVVAGITAATIGVDQASKAFVRSHASERELRAHDGRVGTLPVVWDPSSTDEFAIVHVENDAAPLALGGGKQSKTPTIAALGALPLLAGATLYAGATMAGRGASITRAAAIVGTGLAMGGALSNGVEQIHRGEVTDMLFVSRQMIAWNGADVALAAGGLLSVGALAARVMRGMRHV